MTTIDTNLDDIFPNDQQEREDDLQDKVSFKDALVMNADWTIETIDSQISKGNIDLQPGFQRRAAWDDTRKSRLIESIIVGMPVPNIVLAENKEHRGRFIVIDGKQRLLAIKHFFEGTYRLQGLDLRPELNGLTYNEIPHDDKDYLDNSTLRSTVIRNWSDQNFLYVIFFRLNSGSLPLSPQELRKALVGGNLLEEIETYLKQSNSFRLIFGTELDKRMRDSELVLRFIAYDRNLKNYKGNFKEFLDATAEHFESNWEDKKPQIAEALVRCESSLEAAHKIFDKDVFRKWLGTKYERVINRAIFDCVARFFADERVRLAAVHKQQEVITAFKELCLDDTFRDAIEKTPKTVSATFSRIEMWGKKLAQVLGMTYDNSIHRII